MDSVEQQTGGMPDMKVSVAEVFGFESPMQAPAYSTARGARAGRRRRLHLRPRHDACDPRGLRAQPPRDDHRLSRHGQVDAYRAGRRAPELALRADQPRQPRVAHRPRGQGRDRPQGWQAGHRVPRRHAAVGAAEQRGALLRRVRRRPARCDVRDPARARVVRPPDAARPEAGHQAASCLPAVRNGQYGGARRHLGPLSRHAADQSGPDGPLVDRRDPQLPAARPRGRHRAGKVARSTPARKAATRSAAWCGSPTSPATPSWRATCRPS